jgi:hypothetical protein
MSETTPVNHEKESALGLSTLELVQRIIKANPSIAGVYLRPFVYIADRPSTGETSYPFPAAQFLALPQSSLDSWALREGEGYNIALDSTVDFVNGQKGHLIMMDLAAKKSEEGLTRSKEQFSKIIKPNFGGGFFLETDGSYHYVGEKPVEQSDWQRALGYFLITSRITRMPDGIPNIHERIVDDRYIGHSLIRGTTGLRLTTLGKKKVIPTVVDYI